MRCYSQREMQRRYAGGDTVRFAGGRYLMTAEQAFKIAPYGPWRLVIRMDDGFYRRANRDQTIETGLLAEHRHRNFFTLPTPDDPPPEPDRGNHLRR